MTTAPAPAAKAPLVTLAENGRAVTSSRNIAEVFGKRHADVLRAIEKLECSVGFRERNFALTFTEVPGPNGAIRREPEYHLTRDGCAFLIMGFTGKLAAQFKEAYIAAFNALEERLQAYHMPLEPEDRAFYGKVRIRQLPLLHRQSRQLLAGLKREADHDQRRNLYWALHRVNCVLGIPVPSMQALGLQRPEIAAQELSLDNEKEPRA